MRELLLKILDEYNSAKKESFKAHQLANYLRVNSGQIIEKEASIDTLKYKVEGSPGKGNWADIPWIAIFDKDITMTATKGYDIVYLFCADMSGVYISLNQGWTYFKKKYGIKEGRKKIEQVSSAWKNILSSTLTDFSYDSIDLRIKNNNLAEGYELGHICGKFYDINDIPSDKELIQDLQKLLGVYRELKGRLRESSIEKTNDYLIVNSDLGLFEKVEDADDLDGIESSIENYTKSLLEREECPTSFVAKDQKPREFVAKKTDFLKKAKNQKKLGYAGELMVLNYEFDLLNKNGRADLAQKVKHISEDEGDGAGYDILSYELDGREKHIEVKTTTGDSDTPFNITDSELEFSGLQDSNYYLYRVYEFNKEKNQGKFYYIKGHLSNKLCLRPQNYIVNGLLNVE